MVVLDRFAFYDEDKAEWLTERVVLAEWVEGVWKVWLVGYGLAGRAPNDIMLDVGYNTETKDVGVTISKLAWNRVSVYFDGVYRGTFGGMWMYNQMVVAQTAVKADGFDPNLKPTPPTIPPMPDWMFSQVERLSFYDVDKGVWLTSLEFLGYWQEDNWKIWLLGYGIPGYAPNDIILDVGYNEVEGKLSATICKLAWNRVTVKLDGVDVCTFGGMWDWWMWVDAEVAVELEVVKEVLARLTGTVLAGIPAPSMSLEILDKEVSIESGFWAEVPVQESRSLEVKITELGDHEVYGRMTLENPVGRVSYETPRHRFTL